MARYRGQGPSAGEAIGGCLGVAALILFILGVTFALDSLAAQFVIWTLSGFHVVSGFWHAFMAVATLEMIVSLGAAGGVKASK